jgi:hypothetical protein
MGACVRVQPVVQPPGAFAAVSAAEAYTLLAVFLTGMAMTARVTTSGATTGAASTGMGLTGKQGSTTVAMS